MAETLNTGRCWLEDPGVDLAVLMNLWIADVGVRRACFLRSKGEAESAGAGAD